MSNVTDEQAVSDLTAIIWGHKNANPRQAKAIIAAGWQYVGPDQVVVDRSLISIVAVGCDELARRMDADEWEHIWPQRAAQLRDAILPPPSTSLREANPGLDEAMTTGEQG